MLDELKTAMQDDLLAMQLVREERRLSCLVYRLATGELAPTYRQAHEAAYCCRMLPHWPAYTRRVKWPQLNASSSSAHDATRPSPRETIAAESQQLRRGQYVHKAF